MTGCHSAAEFPPGLIGEIAHFIFDAAPRPVAEIAFAASVGLMAGLVGRAYNVSGTGLNQYLLVITPTGRGKEAIASGISKLTKAVQKHCPGISDFEGPGEIASAQALTKWLARSPCIYSIVGEFGLKLKEMSAEKAQPNVTGLKRALLQLYHKSGRGSVFSAMAYSKREENVPAINSPSFTLIGEATPKFYEDVNEGIVLDGLLTRFLMIEYLGKRVEYNAKHNEAAPTPELTNKIVEIVAHCASLGGTDRVCDVAFSPGAQEIFDSFNRFCDEKINNDTGGVAIELWNRAHLKALKLAALYAVGCNYHSPTIEPYQAQEACAEVNAQTAALVAKFSNAEIGIVAGNEAKQLRAIENVIALYATSPFEKYEKYGGTIDMHRDRVIPASHIQRRLVDTAAFRGPGGATRAINEALKRMLDADEIRQVSKDQMIKLYGTGARAFAISNGKFIIEALAA